ncbi:MAG TPA: FAD-dependent oxidoreductase [Sporichthya sp.]|nr:FAD-dependent oxidoreductase [Sporichthya sp.]
MTDRVVVIGGDAAGMSAASMAKRLRPDLELIVFERGQHTSYSMCGIPYWVAGDVPDWRDLVARTPEEHRRNGIDVRLNSEVTAIDPAAGTVEVRDPAGGTATVGWDHLVLGTGAEPIRPDLPGIDAAGVFEVQRIPDGAGVLAAVAAGAKRAVVVGAGYIGIEMAEALVRRGLEVAVVDREEQPMGTLDTDMGVHVRAAMEGEGIEVRTGVAVEGFETFADAITGVVTDRGTLPADLVICALGARPAVGLARDAGLAIGDAGGIRTDDRQQVAERIWAGGDCVEVRHRISGRFTTIALGTHANRHGRVIGSNVANIAGREARFPGVIGTAVSKVCTLEIGRTGLGERAAAEAGFDAVAITIESTTRAGYMPDGGPIWVKLIAERGTGRVLGGQIVGHNEGAAKRIDVVATAVWTGLSAGELAGVDLSYAPPFSPLWDPVTLAARAASQAAEAPQ